LDADRRSNGWFPHGHRRRLGQRLRTEESHLGLSLNLDSPIRVCRIVIRLIERVNGVQRGK